jgi:hypothetical protein
MPAFFGSIYQTFLLMMTDLDMIAISLAVEHC